MKLINKIIVYITTICLIITTIISIIDFCCFDKNFYYKEYQKNNTLELIKTNQSDLEYITETTLDYLKNKNDDLDILYNHNGFTEHVFKDIELIHMSDVKDLYLNVITLRLITLIITLLGIIYIFIKKISVKKEYFSVLILFFVILALIGISCIVDFNSFWISFHKLFFTKNDYWLLDPNTCILVNLFTGDFFFDLCTKICILSISSLVIYTILVFIYDKKKCN